MPVRLLLRNLLSHPLRALLTFLTLALAIFLICFLRSLLGALSAGIAEADTGRLMVQSAVSLFVDLPQNYQQKIDNVDGVQHTCKMQWFGAYYQEPDNFFAQFGIDADHYFDTFPEVGLIDGDRETFQRTKSSCIIGQQLATRFDWGVGDTIPLIAEIFPHPSGGAWEFEVAGIFTIEEGAPGDENVLLFHWDYLADTFEEANGVDIGVGVYAVKLEAGADATRVMGDIDQLFASGPQRVQATTESEFGRQFVSMFGSVPYFLGAIGAGVLFAIVLAAINTMLMAGRERVRDVGILKALGFGNLTISALFLVESLALCGGGGVFGLFVLKAAEPGVASVLAGSFPGFSVSAETVLLGIGAAVAIGLVAGIAPAWSAGRMKPVTALRAEV